MNMPKSSKELKHYGWGVDQRKVNINEFSIIRVFNYKHKNFQLEGNIKPVVNPRL